MRYSVAPRGQFATVVQLNLLSKSLRHEANTRPFGRLAKVGELRWQAK